MNPQVRQRWLLIGAAACVLLLGADKIVLTPMISAWKDRSARIKELQQSVDGGELLIDRQDTLQSRWKQIAAEALPADAPTAENEVLNAVNGWASDSRFNVTSLKPRWIEDENLGRRLEVRVSGTGNLESVSRFIYALETSNLPLRLEDVSLSARDDSGREIGLDARFSGLTSSRQEVKS